MNPTNKNILQESFWNKQYHVISETELNELLQTSQIIFEQDTRLRDFIRILKLNGNLLLQEKTNLGDILIRRFETEADAMKLVNERMEIYDKMWDGCGCKINYYE